MIRVGLLEAWESLLEPRRKACPFDVVRNDIAMRTRYAHVVHGHNAGMFKLREPAGLLQERRDPTQCIELVEARHLDRHSASQLAIKPEVDRAEAASANDAVH